MNVEERQHGLAMGIYMAGTKIGPAIGAPIAAFLVAWFDWRTMFLLIGLTSLIWLIPWMLLVPADKPAPRTQQETKQDTASFWSVSAGPI